MYSGEDNVCDTRFISKLRKLKNMLDYGGMNLRPSECQLDDPPTALRGQVGSSM